MKKGGATSLFHFLRPLGIREANTLKTIGQSLRKAISNRVFALATSGYCIIFATMAHYL